MNQLTAPEITMINNDLDHARCEPAPANGIDAPPRALKRLKRLLLLKLKVV